MPNSTIALNIAHRGARAFAPENNLVAFAKAKKFGCDMIELDVRLSKDKKVVVYHDEHLKRCTDAEQKFPDRASYQVDDFTYKELRCLDAGSWYVQELTLPNEKRQTYLQSLSPSELSLYLAKTELQHYASGEVNIPNLTEALALAKEAGLKVNVELKSHAGTDPVLIPAVLGNIKDTGMENRVLISSFNHALVGQVRLQTKAIETAILIDKPLRNPLSTLRKLKAGVYNLGCYYGFKDENFDSKMGKRYLAHIAKLRHAGIMVNVWTCNDPEEMALLLKAGISGLITDYPNRLQKLLVGNKKNLN